MFNVIKDISQYLLKHPSKRYSFRNPDTINKIIVHQTDSEDMGAFSPYYTASYHVNTNDWAGIGYHYYIIDDGSIYQTNSDDLISYHASGINTDSLGVAITGDHRCELDADNYTVINQEKYNALVFTLAKLSNRYNLSVDNILGHTETGSPKSCPNLNLTQLRLDVKKKGFGWWAENSLSLCA
jgi:N-acetyl-anhydromuramyl-L-alanine amidase AmpD